jgi:hypothetical protein
MSLGAARFVLRRRCDGQVLAVALLGLGAKGYLTVDQIEGTFRLRRLHLPYEPLEADEEVLGA